MRALMETLAQQPPVERVDGGTAEAVLFWVLGPVALGASMLMVLSKKAVHAALWLVLVFFCLAVFYAAQDAPFLAAVQVVVYTGAIMVLFLFVLMLVGVDRSDSLVETIRGHRIAAVLVALGFAGLVGAGFADAVFDLPDRGLADANGEGGNVRAIAELLYRDYVFAFEATSALLIVAAVGAMVLGHHERTRRPTQREMARQRFAGTHPTPLPGPGVSAEDQSVREPALLPGGTPAPGTALVEDEGGA